MGAIVNLRHARKDRARADADAKAQDNRIAFGRTKAEKLLTTAQRRLAERRLEDHRLDHALDRAGDKQD